MRSGGIADIVNGFGKQLRTAITKQFTSRIIDRDVTPSRIHLNFAGGRDREHVKKMIREPAWSQNTFVLAS
jgi:hypothetical protein